MSVHAVIFDLGGTLCARLLVSYEEQNATALMRWLQHCGFPVNNDFVPELIAERRRRFDERASSVIEIRASEALEPVLRQSGAPLDSAFVAEAEVAYFAPELDAMQPLPGAVDLLRQLHQLGLFVGLASNASSHYFVAECCRRLQFAPYLDPIVSSAGVGWAKPDPRIFRAVLTRWSLPSAAVVMVGDTVEADIVGAHRLGLRTILLTAEHQTPDIFRRSVDPTAEAQPDAVAADLQEVGRLVEGWR